MANHPTEFTIPRDRLLTAARMVFEGARGDHLTHTLKALGAEKLSDLANDHLFRLLVVRGQMSSLPGEAATYTPSRPEQLM